MNHDVLIKKWAKLCENKKPLENASSKELIPYVGEEIKKMKESLEKCLKDVAYKFEKSKDHAEMMKKYKKVREVIDKTRKELVDEIHAILK